ncbi:hypothetical protein CTAYLR_009827 [Chrysophaeum taylorii]|uniref:Rab3-GAP regulatory subunit N-terminal domain-containing protein n=1 Tax=Chrysophaeum taylorii TaxID=2483200 RepID=A0AAD7UDF4_9STRA|nr:hypothetical protein CTAYLR_009827 [Chrysophaeum taylorii]
MDYYWRFDVSPPQQQQQQQQQTEEAAADRRVAWTSRDAVHLSSSSSSSSSLVIRVEQRVTAVAWLDSSRVVVGDAEGVVRVFDDAGVFLWAATLKQGEAVDEVVGRTCRCGRYAGFLGNESFERRRLLPAGTAGAAFVGETSAIAVGSKPAIAACSWPGARGWLFKEEFETCGTFAILDDARKGRSVVASADGRLCAVGDDIGRVLLVDAKVGRVVRVWKGVRDAECSFVAGCLALLAPRRATLRLFRMRFGGVVAAFKLRPATWRLAGPYVAAAAMMEEEDVRVARIEVPSTLRGRVLAPSGRDAKSSREFKAALRRSDLASALAAFAEMTDLHARARALDEAARTEDNPAILQALVEAATLDPRLGAEALAAAGPFEAWRLVRSMSSSCEEEVVDETRRGDEEALAWLDAAPPEARSALDEAAEACLASTLRELEISATVAREIAAAAAESPKDNNRSAATFYRGALVWRALFTSGEEERWRRAVGSTFCRLESDATLVPASVAAPALAAAADTFVRTLLSPLAASDVFGLRDLAAAEEALGLSRPERCRLCVSWLASLDAKTARRVVSGPVLSRWLKDVVVDETCSRAALEPIVEARLDTTRPARILALVSVAFDVVSKLAESREAKTYGQTAAVDPRWGLDALAAARHELRVVALLRLGPPRASATARDLDSGNVLVADLVAADAAAAACAPNTHPPLHDDRAVAVAVATRRDRGWAHACFPDLDPDALRCSHALATLSEENATSLVDAARQLSRVIATRDDRRLRAVALAAATVAWRRVASRLLSAAMRPDAHHLPVDDDDDGAAPTAPALVDACATLIDLFVDAESRGDLEPLPDVARFLESGGSVFSSAGAAAGGGGDDDVWPRRDLGPRLGEAWAHYEARPPCAARVRQLHALKRCLRLALDSDLPLSCVADRFGLAERSSDHLLELETPPRDDVAAFADLAEAALKDAVSDPSKAQALRLSACRHLL